MSLPNSTKSKILLSLIKNAPGILNQKAVRTLIVDPKKALFGYEDGAVALDEVASPLENGETKEIEKRTDELNITNLFPNAKLAAELEAAHDTERQMFDDFTDAWDKLNEITKKLDEQFGNHIEYLLDEIATVDGADIDTINKVRAMDVTLETVNSENARATESMKQRLQNAKKDKDKKKKCPKCGKEPCTCKKSSKKGKEDDDIESEED